MIGNFLEVETSKREVFTPGRVQKDLKADKRSRNHLVLAKVGDQSKVSAVSLLAGDENLNSAGGLNRFVLAAARKKKSCFFGNKLGISCLFSGRSLHTFIFPQIQRL